MHVVHSRRRVQLVDVPSTNHCLRKSVVGAGVRRRVCCACMNTLLHIRVAVIVPCLNEEMTVGGVIDSFRAALPEAEIVVVDNA